LSFTQQVLRNRLMADNARSEHGPEASTWFGQFMDSVALAGAAGHKR
jgi:hypothetical protein